MEITFLFKPSPLITLPDATASAQPTLVNDRQSSVAGTTGIRAPMSPDRAKAWAGTPTGPAGVRTATGYRAPMTGERAARWAGEATGLSLSAIRAGEGSEAVV